MYSLTLTAHRINTRGVINSGGASEFDFSFDSLSLRASEFPIAKKEML